MKRIFDQSDAGDYEYHRSAVRLIKVHKDEATLTIKKTVSPQVLLLQSSSLNLHHQLETPL